MSEQNPIEIKISTPPPSGTGAEGSIANDKDYCYLYVNGQWIRVPLNDYRK